MELIDQLKLAIFDRIPMPIWACDRNCKIVFWNDAAARLYDYSAEEAIGKDFVDLFVNPPEAEKARADCIDIIDRRRVIKNMADDKDRHGNTRKLVTHCFPVYNIGSYEGLQVEVSYEVQDISRLEMELRELQAQFGKANAERETLHRQLMDMLRNRCIGALQAIVAARREDIRSRVLATDAAGLNRNVDKRVVEQARKDIADQRALLFRWETEMRRAVMSAVDEDALEVLISRIEMEDGLGSV